MGGGLMPPPPITESSEKPMSNGVNDVPLMAALDALDKAYSATMKCVVVNMTFKKVAERQAKIKQVKCQLKTVGFDN